MYYLCKDQKNLQVGQVIFCCFHEISKTSWQLTIHHCLPKSPHLSGGGGMCGAHVLHIFRFFAHIARLFVHSFQDFPVVYFTCSAYFPHVSPPFSAFYSGRFELLSVVFFSFSSHFRSFSAIFFPILSPFWYSEPLWHIFGGHFDHRWPFFGNCWFFFWEISCYFCHLGFFFHDQIILI